MNYSAVVPKSSDNMGITHGKGKCATAGEELNLNLHRVNVALHLLNEAHKVRVVGLVTDEGRQN